MESVTLKGPKPINQIPILSLSSLLSQNPNPSSNSPFTIITMPPPSMASSTITFFFFFSLFLSFSLSSSTTHNHHHLRQHLNQTHNSKPLVVSKTDNSSSEIIQQACKATRFPIPCETTLLQNQNQNHSSSNLTTIDIINSSIQISIQSLKTAQSMIQNITLLQNNSSSSYSAKQNRSFAVKNGLQALHYSEYRLSLVVENLPCDERIKDVRAWASAALLYQYSCWSGLKNIVYNDDMSQLVNETVMFMDSLNQLTSNALSIMVSYDLFGNDTASWKPPMTERSGFWEVDHDQGGEKKDVDGDAHFCGFPTDLTVNVTVCKEKGDGCDYETIQAAVDAAPEENVKERFVIRIREGVYKEIVRVPLKKKNVVFLGDGMGKTVITGSLNVGMSGISTSSSATVGVFGDGFMARDITFENTAGPDAKQAVAFRSDSDQSIFESCEFLGNQDTLYASSLRQFYNSCRIEGNIDFIFGNSATVFENCLIRIRPRQINPEKGAKNVVTACGRNDPAQSTGFVFRNCVVNGTDKSMELYDSNPKVHKNYLGRPWKEYSRTVFINCYLERLINPEGWMPWDGDFALSTLYYGELNSSGPGAANVSARVAWSSQIPEEHVNAYSLKNFIQSDEWML